MIPILMIPDPERTQSNNCPSVIPVNPLNASTKFKISTLDLLLWFECKPEKRLQYQHEAGSWWEAPTKATV